MIKINSVFLPIKHKKGMTITVSFLTENQQFYPVSERAMV